MKKLFLVGLVAILFAACQEQPERYTTISANIDEVKALVADYNAGNWEGWLGHYADTAKLYHNTWNEAASPQELQEALKGILSNTSSYGFADKNADGEDNVFYDQTISDEGNTWVNFWGGWKGTMSANGQEIEVPVHLTCKMVDGKIVEEYAFYDLSQFNAAMQAIAAENAATEETAADESM